MRLKGEIIPTSSTLKTPSTCLKVPGKQSLKVLTI